MEQFPCLVTKGFFRPSDEVASVIFCVVPEDFEHLEFRAVWREKHRKVYLAHGKAVIKAMMDSRGIQDDESPDDSGNALNQVVHESRECFPFGHAKRLLMVKMPVAVSLLPGGITI